MVSEEIKKQAQEDYKNGMSSRDIGKKYGYKSISYVQKYLLDGKTRSLSEANKLAHEKYPEKFHHSEETKKKLREINLERMKKNPSSTPWRLKNQSYPEKLFEKFLEDNGFSERYLIYREFPVFPYFIDFAFPDLLIAVEIDGSQHLLPERVEKDTQKDKVLSENGWRVLRITAKVVNDGCFGVKETLDSMISNNAIKYEKVGILTTPKKVYIKKERDENGYTEQMKKHFLVSRKVKNRPSKTELWCLVLDKSFESIGKDFGVTGATIKKWCKFYGLPYKRKDINRAIV